MVKIFALLQKNTILNVESLTVYRLNSFLRRYWKDNISYYVFHGLVTLFFANNFLTQFRITMKFLHNFF